MPEIRLNKKNKSIKIVNRKNNIKLKHQKAKLSLHHTGKTGPKGDTGEAGKDGKIQSIVAGTNVIVDSSDPANLVISAPNTGGDKNFTTSFTNQTSYTVKHNLLKYPGVTVIDSSGDEVEGGVEFVDLNTIRLVFSAPLSGTATLN